MENKQILRGEIYYVVPSWSCDGSEQAAGRPVVIVSNDKANAHSPVLEVVYLTTKPKNPLPTHVDVLSAERPSIALCEQINSVSVNRIREYVGTCTEKEMALIDGALCVSLALEVETVKAVESPKKEEKPVVSAIPTSYEEEAKIYKKLYHDLLDRLLAR